MRRPTRAPRIAHFKHGRFAAALKELQPEAEKNDAAALYVLGKMHSAGLGVPADTTKAAEFFKRGAELGDAASQNDYGAALALCEGVEQNVPEAVKWLMIAARQGHEKARRYIDGLIRYMPRAQVAEIRKSAIEWESKRREAQRAAGKEGDAPAGAQQGSDPTNIGVPLPSASQ
jgi:TPR repeat protein